MLRCSGSEYSSEKRSVPSAQNLPRNTRGLSSRAELRVSVIVPQPLVYFFCAVCTPSQMRASSVSPDVAADAETARMLPMRRKRAAISKSQETKCQRPKTDAHRVPHGLHFGPGPAAIIDHLNGNLQGT